VQTQLAPESLSQVLLMITNSIAQANKPADQGLESKSQPAASYAKRPTKS